MQKKDINPFDDSVENYSKGTYARHQQLILLHFGYSEFDELARTLMTNEIKTLVRVQCRPKLILLDIIQVLIRKKISTCTIKSSRFSSQNKRNSALFHPLLCSPVNRDSV